MNFRDFVLLVEEVFLGALPVGRNGLCPFGLDICPTVVRGKCRADAWVADYFVEHVVAAAVELKDGFLGVLGIGYFGEVELEFG